ncbi:MAG TPA: M15 family metallopeptidase [Candidatus Bipolaricaulota bacterium]|nr:M15 family metallopeptidase [Candidatus Bipolaricaulota bacterium]
MTLAKYTSIEIKENNELMVDLGALGFLVEPKYFQQGLSTDPRMLLRIETAQKLLKVQKILGKIRLKIWDAFRSRDVQNNIYQKYWAELKTANPDWNDEKLKLEVGKFVSPPYQKDRIPPHTTGGTVDLTLVNESGNELDMGTEFDFFGPEARPFFYEIYKNNTNITNNRRLLREAMEAEGFTLDEDEWWHFDWGNQMWALKSGKPFAFYGEANSNFFPKSPNSA